jgi:hypothetical protein
MDILIQTANMKKGFIIYALGHRNYYQMAETLAASLRFNGAENIALLCDFEPNVVNPELFSNIIELDITRYMENGHLVFNKATICMYDHSPYDVTIKLDADLIWLNERSPMDLFTHLEASEVMHMNRGHGWNVGNSVWTDEDTLKEAYGFTDTDKLYKIYGEFVYFKKGETAKKYFKTVKSVFNRPKVQMTEGFANGTFTDELAYQIASIQQGLTYIDNFTPVLNKYLDYRNLEFTYAYALPKSFYAYSIGGNSTHPFMREQYNILAKHYFHQLGLQNPYQVRDKKTFLPERIKR